MPSRRARMGGRGPALLPLRAAHLSDSISCWYCEFKIYARNRLMLSFGQRHARFLLIWFAFGVVASLLAIVGVTMVLLLELVWPSHLFSGTFGPDHLLSWLFGTSPLAHGFDISIMDTCFAIFSTFMSVAIHEIGHVIAAASMGIQVEHISIFLAVLIPGALVAFNDDLLQNLPHFAALQIYCAGIWHNLVFAAVCWLTISLLPWILYPLYLYGEGPMVLDVAETSPLSGNLLGGDVVVSMDGSNIKYPHEWMEKIGRVHSQVLHQATGDLKGYCVPNTWLGIGEIVRASDGQLSCPEELAAFVHLSCCNSSLLLGGSSENRPADTHCLIAKDVVELKKCGGGWEVSGAPGNNCVCSEGETCMTPVQMAGMSWVEISYSSPYSSECLELRKNSSTDSTRPDYALSHCGGTFVFTGNVLSLAYSVKLSAYRPRWPFITSNALIPTMVTVLEKILTCNVHISATLGLVNSLPVYCLDGESILEVALCCVPWFNPIQRRKVLRFCLAGWTILSIIFFSRIFYRAIPIHG